MRDRRGITSSIFALVALAGITVAWSSAQAPLTTKLAPEVREYVKVDDAVIALSHIRVIDGTGQPARDNSDVDHSRRSHRCSWRRDLHADSAGYEGARSPGSLRYAWSGRDA